MMCKGMPIIRTTLEKDRIMLREDVLQRIDSMNRGKRRSIRSSIAALAHSTHLFQLKRHLDPFCPIGTKMYYGMTRNDKTSLVVKIVDYIIHIITVIDHENYINSKDDSYNIIERAYTEIGQILHGIIILILNCIIIFIPLGEKARKTEEKVLARKIGHGKESALKAVSEFARKNPEISDIFGLQTT